MTGQVYDRHTEYKYLKYKEKNLLNKKRLRKIEENVIKDQRVDKKEDKRKDKREHKEKSYKDERKRYF